MLSRCLKVSFCLQVKMWRVLAITDWPCKWTTGSSTLGNHTWWHKTTSRWKVCIFDTGSKPIWFNLGPRAEADHTPHLSTESSGVHRVVLMRSYCTWFISTLLRDDYKFLGSKNWILWSPIYFAHVAKHGHYCINSRPFSTFNSLCFQLKAQINIYFTLYRS